MKTQKRLGFVTFLDRTLESIRAQTAQPATPPAIDEADFENLATPPIPIVPLVAPEQILFTERGAYVVCPPGRRVFGALVGSHWVRAALGISRQAHPESL